MRPEIVVIGSSLGGMRALEEVICRLPADFPLPVIVAQHRSAEGEDLLGTIIQKCAVLPVREAEDKETLRPSRVYLAPGGYHLLLERGAIALSTDAPVRFARPSIDVLFESASEAYGAGAVGVVLTGASDDGAAGAAAIKARGGMVIVQDPAGAESGAMPRAAIDATQVDVVLPLDEIASFLLSVCTRVTGDRSAGGGDAGGRDRKTVRVVSRR